MLIRLQDGHGLVNLDQAEEIYIADSWRVKALMGWGKDEIALGSYETAEKALKVLDMIQHQYASVTCVGSVAAVGQVFQMPQDDEVDA